MTIDDEGIERALEEELPGPADLESALFSEALSNAVSYPPLMLESDAVVADALQLMREKGRGCALVVKDGKLIGIFTERDVLLRIAGKPIDAGRAKLTEYMTADPVTLPADCSIAFALNKMVVEGFRHVPLVDKQRRPTGIVSMRNLMEYLSEIFIKDVLNLPPQPDATPRRREGA